MYGKILEINKAARANNPVTKIVYTYDAQGNRISKTLFKNNGTKSYTWYTRDAQGNVMATYQSSGASSSSLANMPLNLTERHIYGSSRLGVYSQVVNVDQGPADMSTTNAYKYYRGLKQYELSNHLGNVLATITDKKKGFDANTDGTIDYYKADIVTAQDYYPFGMLMPGRIGYASSTGDWTGEPGGDNTGDAVLADIAFHEAREDKLPQEYTATNSIEFTPGFHSENGDAFLAYISPAETGGGSGGSGEGSLNNGYYRYGFNGKENDNEVKEVGNQQDYGMRIYDPRISRFLSVDPLTKSYPELSSYQFSSNSPIANVDLDGMESQYFMIHQVKIYSGESEFVKETYTMTENQTKRAGAFQHGLLGPWYVKNGPLGSGQLFTLFETSSHVYQSGVYPGLSYEVGSLYIPSPEDEGKRGGLYFVSSSGGYSHASSSLVSSDIIPISLDLLLKAEGGVPSNQGEIHDLDNLIKLFASNVKAAEKLDKLFNSINGMIRAGQTDIDLTEAINGYLEKIIMDEKINNVPLLKETDKATDVCPSCKYHSDSAHINETVQKINEDRKQKASKNERK